MLKWAVVFLIIAIIAGIFGFTDISHAATTVAQWLFGIFLVLFLGARAIGLIIGSKLGSRLIKSTIQGRRPGRQRRDSCAPVCRIALRCA